MSQSSKRHALTNLSPLILRLAVAGVLIYAGLGPIARPVPSPDPEMPESADAARVAETAPDLTPGAGQDVGTDTRSLQAEIGGNGVRVSFGWDKAMHWCKLGFAAALSFGLLTRLAALAGLGAALTSALAAHELAVPAGWFRPLVESYHANPIAVLLMGAICLSLLVSGSGPLGVDRLLGRRRQAARTANVPVTA